jgi:hypothetical protein
VITLPEAGRLIVATDLQGNVGDFETIERIFEARQAEAGDVVLVVTGDLVHGPEISSTDWPPHLGTYYHGDSSTLLRKAQALAARHPGRVHYLLGNHEHAHVGGPVVSKFFPNEAERLEGLLGSDESAKMGAWIRTWPFVAVAERAGIMMLHAAPHAEIECREDLESLPLEQASIGIPSEFDARTVLLSLLWARTTSPDRARAFLRAVSPDLRVALYGHDVARGGIAIDTEPLLCVSSSFGCFDGDKMYVEWDLSRRVESAADLARDGLKLLYPDAPAVHRAALPARADGAVTATSAK